MVIFKKLKRINRILTKKHLKYLFLVFTGNQIGGLFEMIGIGMIPVIAIYIFSPEKLINLLKEKNLEYLVDFFSINEGITKILIVFVLFFLFKNIYLITMVYLQRRVGILIRNYNVSKLYTKYLYSPYSVHIKKNPSKLIGIISQDTPNACAIIELIMLIMREFFLILFLIILLLSIDPYTFSIVFFIFLFFSFLFIFFARKYSFNKGQILHKDRLKNFQAINQTFESIKDIKILSKENFFKEKFYQLIKSQENQRLFLTIMNVIPRFSLELLTISIIVFVIIFSNALGLDMDRIITTITFLAFSSLRIIPAFKTINSSVNNIIFNLPSLEILLRENDEIENKQNDINNSSNLNPISITFEKEIVLENINFQYSNELKPILKDINLKISKSEKIGLIGSSGSGKTTLINCMLGLLNLNKGYIKSDGVNINNNFSSWRKQVGYVPQDIYLLDDSIKKNVAFGLNDNEISHEKLNDALEAANCFEFLNRLPNGIETVVGNRGIGLSGGQRQRIGIARALYNDPNFLVLDEATNALDEKMEKLVLKKIFERNKNTSIILIAHRLTSLNICDKLLILKDGFLETTTN